MRFLVIGYCFRFHRHRKYCVVSPLTVAGILETCRRGDKECASQEEIKGHSEGIEISSLPLTWAANLSGREVPGIFQSLRCFQIIKLCYYYRRWNYSGSVKGFPFMIIIIIRAKPKPTITWELNSSSSSHSSELLLFTHNRT